MLAALAAGYQPGDTDFGWTRATPWRSLLAATLDQPHPPVTAGEIAAEEDNPTADLIAAWLSLRLDVPVVPDRLRRPRDHRGRRSARRSGDITITRADGRTATLSWPGRVDRMVALHRRDTAELLAEELRRLDPDEVYAETLGRIDASEPPAERRRPQRGGRRRCARRRHRPRGWHAARRLMRERRRPDEQLLRSSFTPAATCSPAAAAARTVTTARPTRSPPTGTRTWC